MGKTADLAMIQQTNIDTLHKEGKSQRVFTERCGCLQSAVSKHIKCKVDWKEDFGLERCTSNRDDCKLEKLGRASQLESVHQESPRSDVFRKRATMPLLNQRQCQKHLTWAVEKNNSFQIKENFAFHLEIKVPESAGRVERHRIQAVKFLKSAMIWAAVTSAGVGPLCFIKSKVNTAVYQEILEHFMLPSADKFYGDPGFLFQQDFSTCPQSQNHFQVVF